MKPLPGDHLPTYGHSATIALVIGRGGTPSRNARPRNARPRNARPRNARPRNARPRNARPRNARPHNARPHNAPVLPRTGTLPARRDASATSAQRDTRTSAHATAAALAMSGYVRRRIGAPIDIAGCRATSRSCRNIAEPPRNAAERPTGRRVTSA